MKKRLTLLLIFVLLSMGIALADSQVDLVLFFGKTCPHCKAESEFLDTLSVKYPGLVIHRYEVYENPDNAKLFGNLAEAYGTSPMGVPMAFIGENYIIGFTDAETTGGKIVAEIENCVGCGCGNPLDKLEPNETAEVRNITVVQGNDEIELPLFGRIDPQSIGLPLFTIILGGLDGFNPCAIWVLCFLLTLLIHAKSRKKMALIGSIFVFSSGFVYFLFMSAWLNFFLIVQYVNVLRIIIALLAVFAGLINVKDFFFFKKGISLTIPDSAKPKLFKKMRALVNEQKLWGVMLGTVVLSFTANTFELLCTAGFPAIYTRVLTLRNMPSYMYYAYLALYNVIYVIPLAVIVGIFTVTLGRKKIGEKEGRILKLISGGLMLILGIILLFRPELLTLN